MGISGISTSEATIALTADSATHDCSVNSLGNQRHVASLGDQLTAAYSSS